MREGHGSAAAFARATRVAGGPLACRSDIRRGNRGAIGNQRSNVIFTDVRSGPARNVAT